MSKAIKSRDEEFAEFYNNIEDYPTLRDVAAELGLAYKTVKNRAGILRRQHAAGEKVPVLIDRSSPKPISLLSESNSEFIKEMSQEDCIKRLKSLYFSNPEKHITRIRFRTETGISDSTWNRYFGTFSEFKRQAGVDFTRQQSQLERNIAKHASVDHYRDFNERRDYDKRYLRESGRQVQVIMGCSDLHDIEIDPFYLRVFIETAKMVQPDIINFGGDIFDLAEFGKYGVDPREWDVVGRIKFVHEHIFKPLRQACPNTQFDFCEGNHEYRLLRHMADATPALKAILSDLLGLTVSNLLGLDEFEINYIAKADLAAYNKTDVNKQIGKSYKVYFDRLLIHHHPHAAAWGLPGWNGHHHHHKVTHKRTALHGAYQWHQLGCGHKLSASYCEGEFWDLGFNIAHVNTASGSVNFEYVDVTDIACVGGMYFYRRPEEMVGAFAKEAA